MKALNPLLRKKNEHKQIHSDVSFSFHESSAGLDSYYVDYKMD